MTLAQDDDWLLLCQLSPCVSHQFRQLNHSHRVLLPVPLPQPICRPNHRPYLHLIPFKPNTSLDMSTRLSCGTQTDERSRYNELRLRKREHLSVDSTNIVPNVGYCQ